MICKLMKLQNGGFCKARCSVMFHKERKCGLVTNEVVGKE